MKLKKNTSLQLALFTAILALVVGLGFSYFWNTHNSLKASALHGTYLENPRTINEFSLKGTDNKPFDNASLQGQWTMVFFGFTSCGYLCPTTMAELGKMYRILEKKGVQPLPRVIMVTLDPKRDDINKLGDYVRTFDPHFVGAKGNEEVVARMTREMGVVYEKVSVPNSRNANNYDIQHTGTVMLFNPQGKLNAFFTTPHKAELLAQDYALLLSAQKAG